MKTSLMYCIVSIEDDSLNHVSIVVRSGKQGVCRRGTIVFMRDNARLSTYRDSDSKLHADAPLVPVARSSFRLTNGQILVERDTSI